MQLEVRGETGEINQYMVKNVENIVEGVKRAYEVEAEIVKAGEATTLPSCPEVLDLIESVAKTVPGVESIERFNKPSGSEDCTLLIDAGGSARRPRRLLPLRLQPSWSSPCRFRNSGRDQPADGLQHVQRSGTAPQRHLIGFKRTSF